MEQQQLMEAINRMFVAVDQREWEKVKASFADEVLLDYTSMAGGEPVKLSPSAIVESWKGILPGFDHTHHQTGNFLFNLEKGNRQVFCYGTASHFLKLDEGQPVWTVVGSYEFDLIPGADGWRISRMVFNLKYLDGNHQLPEIAGQRARKMMEEA